MGGSNRVQEPLNVPEVHAVAGASRMTLAHVVVSWHVVHEVRLISSAFSGANSQCPSEMSYTLSQIEENLKGAQCTEGADIQSLKFVLWIVVELPRDAF